MNTIPQCDPRAGYEAQRAEIDTAVHAVLHNGQYILGPCTEAFEREFAVYHGLSHAIGVANGTDAVALALRACGVGVGDIVFTVSHTAVATVAAIRMTGAVPVYVDVEPDTMTMSVNSLKATLLSAQSLCPELRPRAVVPVHLYGCPCDMPGVCHVAAEAGLVIVEDCAQAHGALIAGRKVGTWGDAAAFSFYPTKNLGAFGDGGMVVTKHEDVAMAVRDIRQYGWRQRYISAREGVNSRLDEMQAAILLVKLRRLDADNEARRTVAAVYDSVFADLPVGARTVPATGVHVYHQYVIRTANRERLRRGLSGAGIGSAIHYPMPVHRQPAYSEAALHAGLPVTDRICGAILSLPMYPQLALEDAKRVAKIVAQEV